MNRSDWRPLEKKCDDMWRKIIHDIFNGYCGLCRSRKMVGVHHIRRRGQKATRHKLLNGMLLCAICHKKVHELKKYDVSYLLPDSDMNKIGFDYSVHYQFYHKHKHDEPTKLYDMYKKTLEDLSQVLELR